MRIFFLAFAFLVVVSFAPGAARADSPAPPPAKLKKPEPPAAPEFPIPKDAMAPANAPGGGGKIKTYEVPRARDAVLAEVRDALKKGGWTISKDETSPRGAVRLEVKQGDKVWKASFVGDAAKTAIVLTLP